MKVSKRQLQSIIKEEKSKLLSERQIGPMVAAQPITRKPTINEQADNPYLEALQLVAKTNFFRHGGTNSRCKIPR